MKKNVFIIFFLVSALILVFVLIAFPSKAGVTVIEKKSTKIKKTQAKKEDIIIWSDTTKLTWDDFTDIEKTRSPDGTAGSTMTFHWENSCINGKMDLKLFTYFSRSMSWVVKNSSKTKALLEHEQLHFDLMEVYARRCRKKIAGMKKNCTSNDSVEVILGEFYKQQDDANLKYDEESDHSRNKVKQQEWADRIRKQLKDLEAYKLTR